MNQVFLSAIPVLQIIEEAGYEAYFVGGSVRDQLLQRQIHDIDIATSATPQEIKGIFKHTVDVGIEHGTILVIYKGRNYEVTSYRTESSYIDYRRPQTVNFVRSLLEDLKRRDFTMNAIAMDRNFSFVDPFNGRKAIENRIIETVGEAKERFNEDALRLMRAIRFVSQLGFQLERNTEIALSNQGHLLNKIAIERIYAEMTKLLSGTYKREALIIMQKTQIYKYLPSIFNDLPLLHSLISQNIDELVEMELWILSLFLLKKKNGNNDLKKWRLSKHKMTFILRSLDWLYWRENNTWTNEQLYYAGEDIALTVERIYKAMNNQSIQEIEWSIKQQFQKLPITSREDLQVSGRDLLQWISKPAGPWIKEWLQVIEKAVLNKQLPNEKNEIRRWVDSCQIRLEKK